MSRDIEQSQGNHYDRISGVYAEHYGDDASQSYRRDFIFRELFKEVDLKEKSVLEAMCGSGETTQYLLEQGASVTGLDISGKEVEAWKQRWPDCDGVCGSVLNTKFHDDSFDAIVVVGGLHHVHPHVNDALSEFYRILKPGGVLCFVEPHAGSLPDKVRSIWYRFDRYFEDNEKSIDVQAVKAEFNTRFTCVGEHYGGGIAYLLAFNSLIFRIPLRFKRFYSPFLFWLERIFSRSQVKSLSCFVVCRWKKLS